MADDNEAAPAQAEPKPICGIIMPISAMPPTYTAAHWSDVRKVFDAAIGKAGMTPQIVSDSFESDVIQRRIISNLYDNPVVICDVSGLNPNVMFELGMRITFKQPVIIVTDDVASIPFDTKVIEHLGYPRDLHIHQMNEFIDKLSSKITLLASMREEGKFKSFIEEFGTFEVLEPTKKLVAVDKLILDRLDDVERSLRGLAQRRDSHFSLPPQMKRRSSETILSPKAMNAQYAKVFNWVKSLAEDAQVALFPNPTSKSDIVISLDSYDEQQQQDMQAYMTKSMPTEFERVFNISFV